MAEDGSVSGSSAGKSWERSWTTDEMRQNAHAWTLAGDAGLLKHLQELSQAVLARTHEAEKSLGSLEEEISTVTAEANTTNNKFLCLANTQFVENRVYDEDEKESSHDEPAQDKKPKEDIEAKMLNKVREALSVSVAVLDTMFEPVEIQASDSEGETEIEKQGTKTLILEPHNPYIHRPLPHLIGSEAFMTDDKIGLGDSPSDGEEKSLKEDPDDDLEDWNESEPELSSHEAKKRTRDLNLSHDSVFDQESGLEPKRNKPVEPNQIIDGLEADLSEQKASFKLPVQISNDFASQLAAKLGQIAPPPIESAETPEKSHRRNLSDDLFGGPHSDEDEDALFSRNTSLFSGPPKLFDDLHDTSNSLWEPEPEEKRAASPKATTKREKEDNIETYLPKGKGNLFSNNTSDEEGDLFSVKVSNSFKTFPQETVPQPEISQEHVQKLGDSRSNPATSSPISERETSSHTTDTYENDQKKTASKIPAQSTRDISAPQSHNKKPAGGVSMFGQADVLSGLRAKLPQRPPSSSSESSGNDPSETVSRECTLPTLPQQFTKEQSSLGGGSFPNGRSDSLQTPSPAVSYTKPIQDGEAQEKHVVKSVPPVIEKAVNESDSRDLFSTKPPPLIAKNSSGLFADVSDDEDDLFAVGPQIKREVRRISDTPSASSTSATLKSKKEDGAFDGQNKDSGNASSQSILTTSSTVSTPSSGRTVPQMDFGRSDIFSTIPPPLKSESKIKKPVSLFDDSDSGDDELLFSSASSAGSRRSQASTDILATAAISSSEKKPLAKKGLFDDDDALFGNVPNDPGIDIFKGSSTGREPPPIVHKSRSLKEMLSDKKTDSEFSQNSCSEDSGSSSKPLAAKSILQDDLFAEVDDSNDDLFSTKPKNTPLNKFVSQGEDVVDDVFGQHPRGAQVKDVSEESNIKNKKLAADPNVESLSQTFLSQDMSTNISSLEKDEDSTGEKQTQVDSGSLVVQTPGQDKWSKTDQQAKKPEPPRTLNIRKETDPRLGQLSDSDDEDLFGSSIKSSSPQNDSTSRGLPSEPSEKPIIASKPTSAFISKPSTREIDPADLFSPQDLKLDDDEDLFASSIKSSSPHKNTTSVTPSTPSVVASNPASKPSTVKADPDDLSSPQDLKLPSRVMTENCEVDSNSVNVSKLRNSLLAGRNGQPAFQIDPSKLLPGAKPPPRQTPPKEQTPQTLKSEQTDIEACKVSVGSEQPVGFDHPIINNATLPSANKARAKIPVKRRPPSSRARREAARASQHLDEFEKESPSSPDLFSKVPDSTSTVNISVSSSILSPSTDEDDLFGVPQDLPPEYENQNSKSADIFSSAPLLSPYDSVENKEEPNGNGFSKPVLPVVAQASSDEPLFVPKQEMRGNSLHQELFDKSPDLPEVSSYPPKSTLEITGEHSSGSLFDFKPDVKTLPVADEEHNAMLHSDSVHPEKPPHQNFLETVAPLEAQDLITEGARVSKVNLQKVDDVTSVKKTVGSSSKSDPLNDDDQHSEKNEDIVTLTEKNDSDDHSLLFPFVKKKPENKQAIKQPLFSQDPLLPSKEEKSSSKARFSGLDDVEDDDIFSSNKMLSAKKTQSTIKSKEQKTWIFSDEDDDDLFQSGSNKSTALPKEQKPFTDPSKSDLSKGSRQAAKLTENIEKKSKPTQAVSKTALFADDDEDDDLFCKPSPFLKNKPKEAAPKSSLFDDDDDDLFGSSSKKNQIPNQSKSIPEASSKPSLSSKLKKGNASDDPLKALLDDS